MRVVAEASLPKHGETQMTLGTGVCFPVVQTRDQTGRRLKLQSRETLDGMCHPGAWCILSWWGSPSSLGLHGPWGHQAITRLPPFLPLAASRSMRPSEKEKNRASTKESHWQQTEGSPESQPEVGVRGDEEPLPARAPPTHAGNNQKS